MMNFMTRTALISFIITLSGCASIPPPANPNIGERLKIVEVTHEEVQKVAAKAETKMTLIMEELISQL